MNGLTSIELLKQLLQETSRRDNNQFLIVFKINVR